jgi:hypothetical protein
LLNLRNINENTSPKAPTYFKQSGKVRGRAHDLVDGGGSCEGLGRTRRVEAEDGCDPGKVRVRAHDLVDDGSSCEGLGRTRRVEAEDGKIGIVDVEGHRHVIFTANVDVVLGCAKVNQQVAERIVDVPVPLTQVEIVDIEGQCVNLHVPPGGKIARDIGEGGGSQRNPGEVRALQLEDGGGSRRDPGKVRPCELDGAFYAQRDADDFYEESFVQIDGRVGCGVAVKSESGGGDDVVANPQEAKVSQVSPAPLAGKVRAQDLVVGGGSCEGLGRTRRVEAEDGWDPGKVRGLARDLGVDAGSKRDAGKVRAHDLVDGGGSCEGLGRTRRVEAEDGCDPGNVPVRARDLGDGGGSERDAGKVRAQDLVEGGGSCEGLGRTRRVEAEDGWDPGKVRGLARDLGVDAGSKRDAGKVRAHDLVDGGGSCEGLGRTRRVEAEDGCDPGKVRVRARDLGDGGGSKRDPGEVRAWDVVKLAILKDGPDPWFGKFRHRVELAKVFCMYMYPGKQLVPVRRHQWQQYRFKADDLNADMVHWLAEWFSVEAMRVEHNVASARAMEYLSRNCRPRSAVIPKLRKLLRKGRHPLYGYALGNCLWHKRIVEAFVHHVMPETRGSWLVNPFIPVGGSDLERNHTMRASKVADECDRSLSYFLTVGRAMSRSRAITHIGLHALSNFLTVGRAMSRSRAITHFGTMDYSWRFMAKPCNPFVGFDRSRAGICRLVNLLLT